MNFVTKKVQALTVTVTMMVASAAMAAAPVAQVQKNGGNMVEYKLLPVKYDPAHMAVVKARHAKALRSDALPASFEISHDQLPPVRDQGQRGTCAYFATVGIIESHYIASQELNDQKVSEECLVGLRNWEFDQGKAYTETDKPDQRPDPNGDLPASIIMTVNKYGVPAATSYSNGVSCVYDGNNSNGGSVALNNYMDLFQNVSTPSMAFGKSLKFNQNTAPTVDTVKATIASGIPVEVGILVYNEMMSGIDWAYDAKTDTDDNIGGGHAIMLTGYKTANGKTVFTFKNSWGQDWGRSGFGTIDDGLLMKSWGYDPGFDFTTNVQ